MKKDPMVTWLERLGYRFGRIVRLAVVARKAPPTVPGFEGMRLVSSRVVEEHGTLIRIETRRDDLTDLKLTRKSRVPHRLRD